MRAVRPIQLARIEEFAVPTGRDASKQTAEALSHSFDVPIVRAHRDDGELRIMAAAHFVFVCRPTDISAGAGSAAGITSRCRSPLAEPFALIVHNDDSL